MEMNKTKIEQYLRTYLTRLNQSCKQYKGEIRLMNLKHMNKLLDKILSYPEDFFTTHGNELLTIVFKLTFYHRGNVFGENEDIAGEENVAEVETSINQYVHLVLTKIITAPKNED